MSNCLLFSCKGLRFLITRRTFNFVVLMMFLVTFLGLLKQRDVQHLFKIKHDVSNKLDASYASFDPDPICSARLKLENFTGQNLPHKPLYFIETANHEFLNPRQSCTVESAVRNSGRTPIILHSSEYLDLRLSNATCQLLKNGNVRFFRYDFESLSKDTPLESLVGELKSSPKFVEHYSDMLRQILIYKFGGVYLDLDFVVLKNLNSLNNSIAMTRMQRNSTNDVLKVNETCQLREPDEKGHIQNAFISLDKGHLLTWAIMENMKTRFSRKTGRAGIGPLLATRSFREVYQTRNISGFSGTDIKVLPTFNFFPIGAGKATQFLWLRPENETTENGWDELFSCSYAVHFYSYLTKNIPVNRNANLEAYAHLAPKHCPNSYWSYATF
ncbi:lactosylceramide 4-alpha-galactosyltransferase-like [Convolutriloba macropyga]|uniref:lactosylceramide 4-alpha-galactosyltransferase-like n=1 Tax=Convolutriloba macropyga TaxID=536237 RepID=UPI003F525923